MWRSRTIFIILCNVSSLWACAVTATHSLHTPNSHFQSRYGSATDANLQKCFPWGLYSKVALLLIIQLFSQLSACLSICPSSPSLFCCSARVSLNHLTLACRRSCSAVSFCFSFSCCSICLNLYCLCISAILLHQINAAVCHFLSLTLLLSPSYSEVFPVRQHVLGTWKTFWMTAAWRKKSCCVCPCR